MRDNFKAWRQKLGAIALVVALSLVGFSLLQQLWEQQNASHPNQHPSLKNAVGSQSTQYWGSIGKEKSSEIYEAEVSDLFVTVHTVQRPEEAVDSIPIVWQIRWGGIGIGSCQSSKLNFRFDLWYVSNWSIVLLLAALSASLFLSNFDEPKTNTSDAES